MRTSQPIAVADIELHPYLYGVGVVELVEDVQRLLPGDPGGVRVARGVVGVAEIDERLGLPVAVAEVTPQRQGPLVADDRLVVVTELVVGVAEAVQRVAQKGLIMKLPV